MTGDRKILKKVFSDLAPRYEQTMEGELNRFWGWSYDGFVQQLIDHSEIEDDQFILDIATGTSVIPRKIIDTGLKRIHIIGLDITEAMLQQGKKNNAHEPYQSTISLTCADGMKLPFANNSYDLVVTGLSAHHMDVPVMLSEIKRVLKPNGKLSIIDVGMAEFWRHPIIRPLTRVATFVYFLFAENITRAVAEARDMINLKTPEGWEATLTAAGYTSIIIHKLPSKFSWIPEPLSIQSKLQQEEL